MSIYPSFKKHLFTHFQTSHPPRREFFFHQLLTPVSEQFFYASIQDLKAHHILPTSDELPFQALLDFLTLLHPCKRALKKGRKKAL